MNKEEEVREYIKDNLNIQWRYEGRELFICLVLEGEVVSKIRFEQY